MSAQSQLFQQASILSGRQMVMLVIVALHALVIGALMTTNIVPDIRQSSNTLTAYFLPRDRTVEPKLPDLQPHPQLTLNKPVHVPQPELDLRRQNPPVPVAQKVPETIPGPTVHDTGPGNVQVASTPLRFHAVRDADEFYPSVSLSLQEEGVAVVKVCVAPSGSLDGKPVIERSSGSSRLDAAALMWAREALRFTPATRGGEPISACERFRVNFTLR